MLLRRGLPACVLIPLAMATMVVIVVMVGCEDRRPLDPAQASSIADSLQRRDNLFWGDPIEVLGPADGGRSGRLWWQLTYRTPSDRPTRIILVDADTGWAELPPPGYQPRHRLLNPPGIGGEPGPWFLQVTSPEDASHRHQLDHQVDDLNDLSRSTGLRALFSVHLDRDGLVSIVYGWHADHGIARDEHVREWLTSRTSYHDSQWIRLDQ